MSDKQAEQLAVLALGLANLERTVRRSTRGALPDRHHTPLQVSVLEDLEASEKGWEPLGKVAGRVGISPASMSGLCDRMVAMDLIKRKRDRRDRRQILMRKAPKGDELLVTARAAQKSLFKKLGAIYSERDLSTLSRLLAKAMPTDGGRVAAWGRKTRAATRPAR
ncbi:winged helix-turn-helix transcriptional regulator [bacterium]|nr:winged helix-turn-helix transcriptional regulator [bacterium]